MAEIALRSAEINRAAYTRQLARDRNALELLLGQPLTPELSRRLNEAVTLTEGAIPTTLPGGLPSDLLVRRPDIRAAEYRLRGANARIGAARAAFFPTISLTGSAGTASASLSGLFEPGSGSWRFLPQITLPLFHGGALRADLDRAHVQNRLKSPYENVIQQAFRDVADGLAGQRTLNDQCNQNNARLKPVKSPMSWPDSVFRKASMTTLRCLIPIVCFMAHNSARYAHVSCNS